MKIPHDIAIFLHFGWTSALTMTLFCLAGNYLDNKLDTFPVIFLIMSLSGVIISTILFIISVKKAGKKTRSRE